MEDTTPLTQSELVEVLEMYLDPLYQIMGGLAALAMFAVLYVILIRPFIKRGRNL